MQDAIESTECYLEFSRKMNGWYSHSGTFQLSFSYVSNYCMTEIHPVHARTLNEDKVKTLNENHGHTLWKLTGRWYKIKKRTKTYFAIKFMRKKNLKLSMHYFVLKLWISQKNSLIRWNIFIFILILNTNLLLCISFSV